MFRVHSQEVAKLRKEVQISKAALEASQAAAKKADADLSAAKAAADAAAAGKTAADKVWCSSCSPYRSRIRCTWCAFDTGSHVLGSRVSGRTGVGSEFDL